MKFCIPTAITCMALSFCSAAVDVALRGSVAHENDIAELDLATLKHAGEYLPHTLDGTSTDANLIAPLVTDLNTGIICASYAIKSAKHKTYLRAYPGGEGADVGTQTKIGADERFTIQNLGNGLYSFQSVAYGTYLRAGAGGEGSIVNLQTSLDNNGKFELEYEKSNVSLLSTHGTYVRAWSRDKGGDVDLQTYSGSWEKFELMCLL